MPHLLKVCPSKLITLLLILFHWPKCSYVIPTCHLFDPPGPLPSPLHLLSAIGGGGPRAPHQWEVVIPAFYGPSVDNRGSYVMELRGPTLCDPRDCNPPGSSVHGIFQAGTLEQLSFPSPRGYSKRSKNKQTNMRSGIYFAGSLPSMLHWVGYLSLKND